MVIIFILLVFTVGQFYLADALSGRDEALKQLQQKISALADELALERQTSDTLRGNAVSLAAQLKAAQAERDALAVKANTAGQLSDETKELQNRLAAEQQTSQAARAQVELLTAEIAALRDQLSKIAAALDVSDAKVKEQQGQIVELGKKLNLALATKVEELARYRSEFFGKLREVLGDRQDIRVVGDRFVFQSEVLFAPGKAELAPAASSSWPVFASAQGNFRQDPVRISTGCCGSTATPTTGRSTAPSSPRTGSCRRRARFRWYVMRWSRESRLTAWPQPVLPTTSRSIPATARTPIAATGASSSSSRNGDLFQGFAAAK